MKTSEWPITFGSSIAAKRFFAIATRRPYKTVYREIRELQAKQRATKHAPKGLQPIQNGVYTKRKWFKDYMTALGWRWTPTMAIGTGGPDELRPGEWRNSNGICGINRRCVYGYWSEAK